MNARMEGSLERMDSYLVRQDRINERLTTAIEDIKTLLQRVVRGSGNGREA